MAVALEPGQSIPVTLDRDGGRDNPPTFLVKAQTLRSQRRIGEYLDGSMDGKLSDLLNTLLDVLMENCTGWKNIDKPFSRESFEDVINYQEGRELLRKTLSAQYVTPDEKK